MAASHPYGRNETMERFPRLFTPEEANQLLPKLRPFVKEMLAGRDEILRLRPSLKPVLEKAVQNGAGLRTDEALEAFDQVKEAIETIQEYGVLVKDVNSGLLDFPAEREGRVVFLCWQHGEPAVDHWHHLEDGFAGRQPL